MTTSKLSYGKSTIILISWSLLIFASCGKLSDNCTPAPSQLVSFWSGSRISGAQVPDLAGNLPGLATLLTTQYGLSSDAFLFLPTQSSIKISPNSNLNFGTAFTAFIEFKTNTQIGAVSQTLLSSGERLSTFDPTQFQFFDTATFSGAPKGYSGGVWDGRFIYLVSNVGHTAIQYDTLGAFTSSTQWNTFPLSSISATSTWVPAFDGRYVYVLPSFGTYAIRYDTQASFTAASSWKVQDLSSLTGGSNITSAAGIFDGKYLYLVNRFKGGTTDAGFQLRYNTTLDFTSPSAWESFDTTTLDSNAKGDISAGFDGRYVYYLPYDVVPLVLSRFDTTLSFTNPGSWSTLALSQIAPSGVPYFYGVQFDGRYLYFAPGGGTNYSVSKFDTTQSLSSPSSWNFFDLSGPFPSATTIFAGESFDGRYIYLNPYYNNTTSNSSGYLTSYDTAQSFTQANAWKQTNLSTLNSGAVGQWGAVFDGRYSYLLPGAFPTQRSVVTQLDTLGSQSALDIKMNTAFFDGRSHSSLGPSFSINTSNGFYKTVSQTIPSAGWHSLAATYDGTTLYLYLDGALVSSGPATGNLSLQSSGLNVGAVGQGTPTLDSLVTGAQIYNRALTSSEIQSMSFSRFCR